MCLGASARETTHRESRDTRQLAKCRVFARAVRHASMQAPRSRAAACRVFCDSQVPSPCRRRGSHRRLARARAFWDSSLIYDSPPTGLSRLSGRHLREFQHPRGERCLTYIIQWNDQLFPIKYDGILDSMTRAERQALPQQRQRAQPSRST